MKVRITPWYDHYTFHVEAEGDTPENPVVKRFTFHSPRPEDDIALAGKNSITTVEKDLTFSPEFYRPWCPDRPQLTTFTIETDKEKAEGRFGFSIFLVGQPANQKAHYHLNAYCYFLNAVRLKNGKPTAEIIAKLKDCGFNSIFTELPYVTDELLDFADEIGFLVLADGDFVSRKIGVHPSYINFAKAKNPEPGMERPVAFEVNSVDEMFDTVLDHIKEEVGQCVLNVNVEDIDSLDKDRIRLFCRIETAVCNLRPHDTTLALDDLFNRIQNRDFETMKPGDVNKGTILILGDSISDFFPTFWLLGDYKVFNRGFSGNRSDQLWDAIPRTAGVLNPEFIFVLIGANDVGHGIPAEATMKVWDQIASELKRYCPKAKVHVLTALPTNPDSHWDHEAHFEFASCRPNSLIDLNNKALPAMCKRHGFTLHDITKPFRDVNGALSTPLSPEGLHLSAAGNIVLMKEYRKILKKLIK